MNFGGKKGWDEKEDIKPIFYGQKRESERERPEGTERSN